jgi:hypothetical protein
MCADAAENENQANKNCKLHSGFHHDLEFDEDRKRIAWYLPCLMHVYI